MSTSPAAPSARVIPLDAMLAVLPRLDLLPAIESAFVEYSRGNAVVPPVGELLLDAVGGDCHIKYGHLTAGDTFVVKVATGFPANAALDLPSFSGVMLVFSARTGMLQTVLLDGGHLTNVRTAVAGAIAARHLAPSRVERIAVLGTGVQARLQLEAIAAQVHCRRVTIQGRRREALDAIATEMRDAGFDVTTTLEAREAVRDAQVIVTTTASATPLLAEDDVPHGALIIAMGSDTEAKQELDAALCGRADLFVVDSRSQCLTRGELHHAITAGTRTAASVVELGEVLSGLAPGRTTDAQLVIVDLTGVAVQDIAIATAVAHALA